MTDETIQAATQVSEPANSVTVETNMSAEPASSAASTAVSATEPVNFLDSLPEDLRKEPSLQSYKDIGSMAKSLVNAQREIGSRIRVPSADASTEAKAEFFKKLESVPGVVALPDKNDPAAMDAFLTKLGRPDSPDKYEVSIPEDVLKYVPQMKERVPEFKVLAHKLGLNKEQANALVGFEMANTEKVIDKMLADKEATTTFLKETWGGDFDNRFNAARTLFTHYSDKYPDAVQKLLNGVEGNNPVLLMMAAELGKSYHESGLITGTREVNYGLTPSEARDRITDILNNPSHDYFSSDNRKREAAIEHVEKLYIAANPETGQAKSPS